MVECIEQLPPFGKDQVLIEYEFLELVEFDIQCKWKKHLIVQGFESGDNILNGLVNFCKNIETAKEIFNDRGDGSHPHKKTQSVRCQPPQIHFGYKRVKPDHKTL